MKRILLVEDDMFIRDIYTRELKKGDFELVVATNGEEGLQQAQSSKFDLILLDIMLPKKTGIDVLKGLRSSDSEFKDTPIYLLTNLGQGSVIKQAMDVGIQGYLLKASFLPSQVLEAVNRFFKEGPMKIDPSELV